ncbi:hypothetical protein JCM10212_001417 [Sporobolomyces blumeae]
MADTLAFNHDLIADGEPGGRAAARLVFAKATEHLDRVEASRPSLVVYFVAARTDTSSLPAKRVEAFLRGFATTSFPSFVVEPVTDGPRHSAIDRISQLLDLYLPLESTTSILLGSLHTGDLVKLLKNLPQHLIDKVTLVSTVTVAPACRQLRDERGIRTSHGLESLFGKFLSPDLAATLWSDDDQPKDSYDDTAPDSESDEEDRWNYNQIVSALSTATPASDSPGPPRSGVSAESASTLSLERRSTAQLGTDAVSSSFEPTEPQASTSKAPVPSGLIWDCPSDEEEIFAVWESETQQGEASDPGDRDDPSPASQGVVAGSDPVRRAASQPSTPPRHAQRPTRRPAFATPTKGTRATPPETIVDTPDGPVSSLASFEPPLLSLSVHPQPCKKHYLSPTGCPKSASTCHFSHAWPFTPQERELFPLFAKGTPCQDFVRGKCDKGEACIQGHRCPFTVTRCPYGRACKFRIRGLPHSSRT